MSERGRSHCNTVFTDYSDPRLQVLLGYWARQRDVAVYAAEPGSSDLLAVPHFVAVIDRNRVNPCVYDQYLQTTQECNTEPSFPLPEGDAEATRDTSIAIFIDQMSHLALPRLRVVMQIDLQSEQMFFFLIDVIETAYQGMRD